MLGASPIPRFHAYLEHIEGRSVLTMPKEDWVNLNVSEGSPIEIDVTRTPMSAISQSASVVAAAAVKSFQAGNEIHIYRFDPSDEPTPYNLDKYSVLEDLTSHNQYSWIVRAASVHDDENLREYLIENVFIVKESPGDDHWLPNLPASALAIVKRA